MPKRRNSDPCTSKSVLPVFPDDVTPQPGLDEHQLDPGESTVARAANQPSDAAIAGSGEPMEPPSGAAQRAIDVTTNTTGSGEPMEPPSGAAQRAIDVTTNTAGSGEPMEPPAGDVSATSAGRREPIESPADAAQRASDVADSESDAPIEPPDRAVHLPGAVTVSSAGSGLALPPEGPVLASTSASPLKELNMSNVQEQRTRALEMMTEGVTAADGSEELMQQIPSARSYLDLSTPSKPTMPESRDRTHFSKREDDEEWFTGRNTIDETKEKVLSRVCQRRMRNYHKEAKKTLEKKGPEQFDRLKPLMKKMEEKLHKDDFNGHYFDRRRTGCLCDDNGQFICRGRYFCCCSSAGKFCDKEEHHVNPYTSNEEFKKFNTFELDHWIQRSQILRRLLEAERDAGTRQINWDCFYRLIFTTENLRLLHHDCHIKSKPVGFVYESQVYKPLGERTAN